MYAYMNMPWNIIMVHVWRKSSDLRVAKAVQWTVILCILYSAFTTVESFKPEVMRNMHSDILLATFNETVGNRSHQRIGTDNNIPYFKGKAKLLTSCDYILYSILHYPIQKHEISKHRTNDLELPSRFNSLYDEAIQRYNYSKEKLGSQICNTGGFEVGFQTPLQCSEITTRCECLVINDLRTVQPLGVVGCMADLGSFCISGAIECAFGYHCVEGKCAGATKWIPKANHIVVAVIILCIMFDFLS